MIDTDSDGPPCLVSSSSNTAGTQYGDDADSDSDEDESTEENDSDLDVLRLLRLTTMASNLRRRHE